MRGAPAIAILALTLALGLPACGGRNLPDEKGAKPAPADAAPPPDDDDDDDSTALRKANEVELYLEGASVSITITDETGSSDVLPVGTYSGTCSKAEPSERAVYAVECLTGGAGVRLEMVQRNDELVILRAKIDGSGGAIEYEVERTLDLPAGGQLRFID